MLTFRAARPGTPPALHGWQAQAHGWRLSLSGDWRHPAPLTLSAAPAGLTAGPLVLDGSGLTAWDGGLAAALWERVDALQRAGVTLDTRHLPPAVRTVLDLALSREALATPPEIAPAAPAPEAAAATAAVAPPVARGRGLPLRAAWHDALTTATFVGDVLLAVGRLLRGRSHLRAGDLWRQIDQAGPLSLPIVSLTCFLVGLMLAYMGGAQLDRIGAQAYIADVVSVGMVREMAGLMTGVILAGRLGAAYAAQLGSMQANEEIDALRALGVQTVDYLVLPRLLALLLVAPLLISLAALVGVLAGLPAAVAIYGVEPTDYLYKSLHAMTWTHLWIGLFKGEIYAGLVALAGCREGLYAGRNAEAVGLATTTAVVKALVWIVAAACGTTVVFQSLGF